MKARRWTPEEDEVLLAYRYKGAAFVRAALLRELGSERTVRSIEQRAHVIHASLRKLDECPYCGAVGVRLNQWSGMCMRCTAELRVEEERAFHELLEQEAKGCDEGPEIEAARREYVRLRKRNSRLCKKYRLQGKRGRDKDM